MDDKHHFDLVLIAEKDYIFVILLDVALSNYFTWFIKSLCDFFILHCHISIHIKGDKIVILELNKYVTICNKNDFLDLVYLTCW